MNKMKKIVLAIVLAVSFGMVASENVRAEITAFPNGLSSWGMPVIPGIGNNMFADVNVYWVDRLDPNAADGAGGGTAEQPFKTIDFAIGRCVAGQGDLILVKPGHIEIVSSAGALDGDISGITVWGIGKGEGRPRIWFTSASDADMDIDATSTTWINFIFEARYGGDADATGSITAAIDVNATDTSFFNIETRDIDGIGSATSFIVADANSDRMLIDGWVHRGTSTTGDEHPMSAISLTGGDDITIRNFQIYGSFDGSAIMATGTPSCTRLRIGGGKNSDLIWTENSTDSAIAVLSSTGVIGPNLNIVVEDTTAEIGTETVSAVAAYLMRPIEVITIVGERSTSTGHLQHQASTIAE
jgi:hypothetical protein